MLFLKLVWTLPLVGDRVCTMYAIYLLFSKLIFRWAFIKKTNMKELRFLLLKCFQMVILTAY